MAGWEATDVPDLPGVTQPTGQSTAEAERRAAGHGADEPAGPARAPQW